MLEKHPEFIIGAITVKKQNVARHIQQDGNKLYNYMMGLSLIEKIENHETCKITRDNRSVKVLSGSSCIDYLQTQIWFHRERAAIVTDNPTDSKHDLGIQFIDWITNMVWSAYEDQYQNWFNIMSAQLHIKQLFF